MGTDLVTAPAALPALWASMAVCLKAFALMPALPRVSSYQRIERGVLTQLVTAAGCPAHACEGWHVLQASAHAQR